MHVTKTHGENHKYILECFYISTVLETFSKSLSTSITNAVTTKTVITSGKVMIT